MKNDEKYILIGVKQVAKYFGVKETTIREWARSKKIPSFKVGKKWLFNRARVLDKQSIVDCKKIFKKRAKDSYSRLFDLMIDGNKVEVKSTSQNISGGWSVRGLHNPEDTDFHLILAYDSNRLNLLHIYYIPTEDLKTYLSERKPEMSFEMGSFTINSNGSFFNKYLIN